MEMIPQLKGHYLDLRLWSIRRLAKPDVKTPSPPTTPVTPPGPPEPPDSVGKLNFDDFVDFEFDFFENERWPDDGMKMGVIGEVLWRRAWILPLMLLCRTTAEWARQHPKYVPKLLRKLFTWREKGKVVTAERSIEMKLPIDEKEEAEQKARVKECACMEFMRKMGWSPGSNPIVSKMVRRARIELEEGLKGDPRLILDGFVSV
jgi:hypothetical protein